MQGEVGGADGTKIMTQECTLLQNTLREMLSCIRLFKKIEYFNNIACFMLMILF